MQPAHLDPGYLYRDDLSPPRIIIKYIVLDLFIMQSFFSIPGQAAPIAICIQGWVHKLL